MKIQNKVLIALAFVLASCAKAPADAPKASAPSNGKPLIIAAEDVVTVRNASISSGPAITGSVQPERRADVRAEIPGTVLQVLRENGDQVRKGDLLVRLDDTSIRDALASAEATQRSTAQALEQAERQFQRVTTLRASGMSSAQALEDAETRRNNLASDLEAAKARVVGARQQLARTEVRAPFDGVVSDRRASAGDTAQVGKELMKVMDPASMRFEGLVSADSVGAVRAGQAVSFRVNGYGNEEFAGKIRRVNPSANPTTRQVEVLVDFTGARQPKLAGLYAEGRVETGGSAALTIPAASIVREGEESAAWRVKGEKLQKVKLTMGGRDPRTGDFAVKAGLSEGDVVLRYPTSMLKDGQAVQAAAAGKTSEVASTSGTTRKN